VHEIGASSASGARKTGVIGERLAISSPAALELLKPSRAHRGRPARCRDACLPRINLRQGAGTAHHLGLNAFAAVESIDSDTYATLFAMCSRRCTSI